MAKSFLNSDHMDRKILAFVWFGFFVINGAIILFLRLQDWIGRDYFFSALKQWNVSYAPYIGAITLFYWSSGKKKALGKSNKNKTAFYLALACSVIWNVLIFIFLMQPLTGSGFIEDAMKNIEDIVFMLSWLVAGAMGYYFANSAR